MMELVEQLRKDGTRKGLCQKYQRILQGNLSMEKLISLFIGGLDFCVSYNFPTLEFMRERFKGFSEPYGVYIDDEVQEPLINKPDLVFNGVCKAMLEYDGYTVSRVVLRHESQCSINASDHACVTVDCYDDSYLVVAVSGDDTRVIVNVHDGAKVECIGKVKCNNLKK